MMRLLLLLLLLPAFSACVTTPPQNQAVPVHGVAIETLQSSVNISLTLPAGQLGGNGVMFYQRPDSFRLVILAPFGQTVLDLIVTGEKVLCLMESKKKAWQGTIHDLPEGLGLKVWPLLQWVVEPPHPAGPARNRSFTRADGSIEQIYYDAAGFVQRKVNAVGDEVAYSDYHIVAGVAVANVIEIRTSEGARLRLLFDEPEINQPIDQEVLNPQLSGYELLPLAEFKEF